MTRSVSGHPRNANDFLIPGNDRLPRRRSEFCSYVSLRLRIFYTQLRVFDFAYIYSPLQHEGLNGRRFFSPFFALLAVIYQLTKLAAFLYVYTAATRELANVEPDQFVKAPERESRFSMN